MAVILNHSFAIILYFTYIGISLWDSSTVVSLYSIISITLTSSRLLHQSFSLCLDDGVCYVNDTHVENFFVLRHTAYPHYEGRSHPSLYYIWVIPFQLLCSILDSILSHFQYFEYLNIPILISGLSSFTPVRINCFEKL